MKIWILTEAFADYDQHGEYFVAWFKEKPTVAALYSLFSKDLEIKIRDKQAVERMFEELLQTGTVDVFGNYQGYHLREVEES